MFRTRRFATPRAVASEPTYDRPTSTLAQGQHPAPRWVIGAIGLASFAFALVFVALAWRRARRHSQGSGS